MRRALSTDETRLTVQSDVRGGLANLISARATRCRPGRGHQRDRTSQATQAQYKVGATTITAIVSGRSQSRDRAARLRRRALRRASGRSSSNTFALGRATSAFKLGMSSHHRSGSGLRPGQRRDPAVSEDRLAGLQRGSVRRDRRAQRRRAERVIERVVAMLRAGTIRRVRQTLMSTNLARGALVAWQVPPIVSIALRLHVQGRSVLGSRGDPFHRPGDAGRAPTVCGRRSKCPGILAAKARRSRGRSGRRHLR